MKYLLTLIIALLTTLTVSAQGNVKGKIYDRANDEAQGYINVAVYKADKLVKGAITDQEGAFNISGLPHGQYQLRVTMVGYKEVRKQFTLSKDHPSQNYSHLFIAEDENVLKEVEVVGQRSSMRLEVDRKSYDVDQQIANAGGSASEVLENIPSVDVDNEGNISLRGNSSVEVWINGKASGLTSDNRADILQNMPAESIERIEVIANPSAKFSPEGSAGIINIILKKDRRAGYYGSIQGNVNTRGGWGLSGNFNYNSSLFDAYVNLGYRQRSGVNKGWSDQDYLAPDGTATRYMNYTSRGDNGGNHPNLRAGITWHATKRDDITLSGMLMRGGHDNDGTTEYHYGDYILGQAQDYMTMTRRNIGDSKMNMMHGELNWTHEFGKQHTLEALVSYNKFKSDNDSEYEDVTNDLRLTPPSTVMKYQYMPMHISNHSTEVKLDYSNQITEKFKLEAGYNGRYSEENTPQEAHYADNFNHENMVEDYQYYNRFIYKQNVHALYATAQTSLGKLGIMAGLRGEYWNVDTKSLNWLEDHPGEVLAAIYKFTHIEPFKKDFFQLFPSLFLNYQLTKTQQLQLNMTRRLRRPWGGQLNSFIDRRDASNYSFGNPELTPEYTMAFELNYLKQWDEHTLSVSAYYRPSTDVMQRVSYQAPVTSATDTPIMYTTQMNVAKSQSSGLEIVAKNHLFRILDLTTTINGYYYKLDPFKHIVMGQTVTGEAEERFTWSGKIQASVLIPWGISLQAGADYRSKQSIIQGYQEPSYKIDLGLRKTFFDRKLALSINCRDVLNSRQRESFTSSQTFTRHQMFRWGGRRVNFSLTWNFGSGPSKKKPERPGQDDDEMQNNSGYGEF